ncbi:hypothetical protein [Cellulophaga baltica]|uniref:Uncharacterized protein n=1 Tax=Cellulophaga baltica TaxID=76594 RepID=A0A1G7J346_9FLAO|nr:hypothetical protein [Cellulophaga baltica]AIY14177.1 hypothetical protein M667_13795 [Cellulophaga baltica NN016038]MBA6315863.1 hypothetical protein [Cellulophaga baltica]SDF19288.1 hypothetical protein SAMN04487992_108180 [Cellulophaga baltica]
MAIKTLEGVYQIIGFNQDRDQSGYTGYLRLIVTSKNRVDAIWTIGGEQTQTGKGFFKDDVLVINFSYRGELKNRPKTFKGVVVYKMINDNVLDGFWSEKFGDDDYLGFEEGRKLSVDEVSKLKL